ncbi:MAG: thioredoxin family protein [Deltaproteobacteria bacterium]|nr:thioredoxin family protein [Deltaproteobacteria bacterium]
MQFDLDGPIYIQLLTAFGFGFLSSFTPCVFPLIPITLSLFGVRDDLSRLKRFGLSVCYVLGICLTYTVLGIISAKTGAVFGSFLGNLWVVAILVLLLTALALYTLDAFQFPALAKMQTSASKIGGKGPLGAFLMGAVSGVVAAPCVGPALVVILGIAASSNNVYWGAALLLAYSLGLGLIFIALGTYSGLMRKMPRAGNWMFAVKFIMAIALILVALFLGQRLFASSLLALNTQEHLLTLLFIENAGLLLAWVAIRRNLGLLKFIAAVMISVALFEVIFPDKHATAGHSEQIWHTALESALSAAAQENRVAMVDLYADWCAECKKFDHLTFSDESVKSALKKFTLARIDFTDTTTQHALMITEKYGVVGLPCIMFLQADGSELPATRITGFLDAPSFLQHLQGIPPAQ